VDEGKTGHESGCQWETCCIEHYRPALNSFPNAVSCALFFASSDRQTLLLTEALRSECHSSSFVRSCGSATQRQRMRLTGILSHSPVSTRFEARHDADGCSCALSPRLCLHRSITSPVEALPLSACAPKQSQAFFTICPQSFFCSECECQDV